MAGMGAVYGVSPRHGISRLSITTGLAACTGLDGRGQRAACRINKWPAAIAQTWHGPKFRPSERRSKRISLTRQFLRLLATSRGNTISRSHAACLDRHFRR